MNFKPLRDWVLVKLHDQPKKTAGGLYVPETSEQLNVKGTVLAVGNGYLTDNGTITPLELSLNDEVLFNKQYAVEIKLDNQPYFLLQEKNIYGYCS